MQSDYDVEFYDEIAKVERKHFWFLHRVRVIELYLKKVIKKQAFKMLEIGAGTCFVSGTIRKRYEGANFYCLDLNVQGLKIGSKNFSLDCVVADISKNPLKVKFDIIGMFDVLEHTEDDEMLLSKANELLERDGIIVLTVPAYKILWSNFDVVSGHKRRYSIKELLNKLRKSNFDPITGGFFNLFLFPVMFLARKRKDVDVDSYSRDIRKQLNPPPFLNLIMKVVNFLERFLINAGFIIPFGTSIIVAAKKNND